MAQAWALVAAATAAALGGCAPGAGSPPALPGEEEVEGEAELGAAARTFVSLNPCLDAILVDIMAPVRDDHRILALSHYSRDPSSSSLDPDAARRFEATGGTAEEIIALSPDIVLASTFLPPATRSALERAGLRVETFASPVSVEESAAQVERLGALAGRQAAAAGLARAIQRPLWPAEERREPGPAPSVLLWQAGQIVAGRDTLIAQLLREEGFANQAATLGLDQADFVALEHVLIDPPDLLLIAGTSAGQRHPAIEDLASTRIHHFDPGLFYCGGPSVSAARRELNALRMNFADLGE
jgi:iron complex transport system substrate-binding protein